MILIGCYEDVVMYCFSILEGGTVSVICFMKVIIDGYVYDYYQSKDIIIITNNKNYCKLHTPYCTIPLNKHFELLELSKKNGNTFYVKINGKVVNDNEYKFIDISRILKIRKIFNMNKQID